MAEPPPDGEEDDLRAFSDRLRAVPTWEPDPAWFARLKAKLLAADVPQEGLAE